MSKPVHPFVSPKLGFLRWLVDPGPRVPENVRGVLLYRMFAGRAAIIMGVAGSLMVNVVALLTTSSHVFFIFVAADLALCIIRVRVVSQIGDAVANGRAPPVDAYLITGLLWCALQGSIACTVFLLHSSTTLEVLSTITISGTVGPICARNYPAPRFTIALVMLCDIPFMAGCALSPDHWLLIPLAQAPLFLYTVQKTTLTFQKLAVDSLVAEQASRHSATHDPLTGLLNRLGLQETVNPLEQIDTARLAVVALDLDGFKTVNDTLGHHVGDAVLAAVATRLVGHVRRSDGVFRLGGDEFMVVLHDAAISDAEQLAQRIVADIGHVPYQIEGVPPVTVGVSLGIACAPEDGTDIDRLHRHADAALYEAKASGRNIYRRWSATGTTLPSQAACGVQGPGASGPWRVRAAPDLDYTQTPAQA